MTLTAKSWQYCACVGTHEAGCPNDVPGGFPPLSDTPDEVED
jgi:hypothetical protein